MTTLSHPTSDKIIVVGKCGAPQGLKGAVKVYSQTVPMENILQYQPWLIQIKGQWQPVKIQQTQIHPQFIAVQFEGVNDRDQAQSFTHALLGVLREQLPDLPNGEYYWTDLEGLEVRNLDGFVFGKITRLIETGANDVMFIKGNKEYCLPYLKDRVIKEIDLKAGKMLVDWPSEI